MDLEELIDSIDIVEYISQFVELEEKNGEYWGLSPFSDEKTPSFSVRRENNTFYCFSSGIGGNVFTFTKFYYQCDTNKAVDILKKYAGCDGAEFVPRRRMAATIACRKYMKKQVRHPRYMELARKYDFLEVQAHNHPDQIAFNERLLELSREIGTPLIAGTDTHSSTPYKAECRAALISAKGKSYGDEDAFDLTYKTCQIKTCL